MQPERLLYRAGGGASRVGVSSEGIQDVGGEGRTGRTGVKGKDGVPG